ncbi:MAG TPA: 2Fe-2S iron-sulfur cluster-binding protein [Rudaea sp.]|nr:2Fe-2S iron-sulfur cluster-binding protein [Rudaea sp.]
MAGAASAFIEQAEAAASGSPAVVGPGSVAVTLKVNGTTRTIEVEPRTTLAEALRGPPGLTGTKVACDRGACSACTVWLGGHICRCGTYPHVIAATLAAAKARKA